MQPFTLPIPPDSLPGTMLTNAFHHSVKPKSEKRRNGEKRFHPLKALRRVGRTGKESIQTGQQL